MENKSNKGLIGLVIVLIIMVLGLGGYIVYDKKFINERENKQVKNQIEEKIQEEQLEVEIQDNTCALYSFNSTYQLTDKDKNEIKESIEGMESIGNSKVDINTIRITGNSSYFLYITFETVEKTGNYELGSIVFKVNNKFKSYGIGSGYDNKDIKQLEYTFSRICS